MDAHSRSILEAKIGPDEIHLYRSNNHYELWVAQTLLLNVCFRILKSKTAEILEINLLKNKDLTADEYLHCTAYSEMAKASGQIKSYLPELSSHIALIASTVLSTKTSPAPGPTRLVYTAVL